MEFDRAVKLAVYQHFSKTGRAPEPGAVAARLGASVEEVTRSYLSLQNARVLVLESDKTSIRMAPPFSGVPTQHVVESGGVTYHANCAWDALGIPAALRSDAIVHSRCGQSGDALILHVFKDGPETSEWLFHCLVPAGRWWQDIVFT